MIDENPPLPTNPGDSPQPSSGMPAPDEEPQSLDLTPEQLASLGFDGCEPGEPYTIKLVAGEKGDMGSQTFHVVSAGPDREEGEPGLPEPAGEEPPQPILDEAADASPDNAPDAAPMDEGRLGYPRKKKSPREGLPDTKKMREL